MKKCVKCGFETDENVDFCARCAKQSGQLSSEDAPVPAPAESRQENNTAKGNKTLFVMLIAGVLITLIATQSIYFIFKRKMESFAVSFFKEEKISFPK